MTRTAEIEVAVRTKLEEIRAAIDVDSALKKLTIEVFFNDGGHVRAAKTTRSTDDCLTCRR